MITRISSVWMFYLLPEPERGVRGFWMNLANVETVDLDSVAGCYVVNMTSGTSVTITSEQMNQLEKEFSQLVNQQTDITHLKN